MNQTKLVFEAGARSMAAFSAAILLLTAGCNFSRPPAEPSIEFTKLPPFDEGSSEVLDVVEGRASGVQPGERVVLYAKSGVWWIQPTSAHPFTAVGSDSTWKNRTHPGSAYAALLVAPGYDPPLRTDFLPDKGRLVLAVAKAEGSVQRRRSGRMVAFGGYEWQVRETPGSPGGTRNDYDPANVSTDASGFLHMRIAGAPNHWFASELNLSRSLGYGSYRFVVQDVSHLEPAAVFSMFTWDDAGPSREMDTEISRWGTPGMWNGQFVIQPYYLPANTVRFDAPPGRVTFMLRWQPERASFRAFRGSVSRWDSPAAGEHDFTSGVPPAGSESVHLNLYVFGNVVQPMRRPTEVIVEKFEYLP